MRTVRDSQLFQPENKNYCISENFTFCNILLEAFCSHLVHLILMVRKAFQWRNLLRAKLIRFYLFLTEPPAKTFYLKKVKKKFRVFSKIPSRSVFSSIRGNPLIIAILVNIFPSMTCSDLLCLCCRKISLCFSKIQEKTISSFR